MLSRKKTFREVLLIVVITACLLLLTGCGAKSETADPTEKPAVSDVGEPAQTEPQEQPGPALPEDGGTERGAENGACFTVSDTGTLISPDGTEYEFLANEGFLYYLGELEFVAYVEGEATENHHLGGSIQTGMFSIRDDPTDHLLIRVLPDSEWYAIYRKASLPDFDFSIDNCSRLEFIPSDEMWGLGEKHGGCGAGITDPEEIAAFLSDLRAQKSARDAGLDRLVTQPNGTLLNCYFIGTVCGFFEEEPNLFVPMEVISYNDLGYSMELDRRDRVLPEEWLPRLMHYWDGTAFLVRQQAK